jgi:hypothetical protein
MAEIASAINVPFGRWRSYNTAAFLNPLGCPRKPNLLIVDLSICGFFEESTDRQI